MTPDARSRRLAELAAEARGLADAGAAELRRALVELVDVTADVVGLAPEDRIYRAADGSLVKVKAFDDDEVDHGFAASVILTGSICGADGKALKRSDDTPAVWRRGVRHNVVGDAPGDPAGEIEAARRRCVLITLSAERQKAGVRDAADGPTQGIVRRSAYKARKRAELEAAGLPVVDAVAIAADLDPAIVDPPPPVAETPPPPRHPSGRRYVLFPGLTPNAAGETVFVSAAQLAAARGILLGQCVRFSTERPPGYFLGLEEIFPQAGLDYPDA